MEKKHQFLEGKVDMIYRPKSSRTASYLMEHTVNLVDQRVAVLLHLSGSTDESSEKSDIWKLLERVTFRFCPDRVILRLSIWLRIYFSLNNPISP